MFARLLWTTSRRLSKISSDAAATTLPQKPKKIPKAPRITLLHQNESISIVELEEAERLSKTQNLKLVKIVDYDAQTRRPLYKLMNKGEYLKEELNKRKEKKLAKNEFSIKGQKVLQLNTTIGEHDIQTRIKNLQKWLSKCYEIKVVISGKGNDKLKLEKLFTTLCGACPPSVKFKQKVMSGNDLKCIFVPTAETPTENQQNLDEKLGIFDQNQNSIQNWPNVEQKREIHTSPKSSREL